MRTFINFFYTFIVTVFLMVGMTSCEMVGDIFKAGAWTGALLVIGGIVLVIWVIAKLFGGGSRNP